MDTEKSKSDFTTYDGPDRIIPAVEMAERFKNEPPAKVQLRSFIPSLDNLVNGFRDGELIAISGMTKQGKTLLAQTLSQAFSRQGHFPLWFSYEVPARQFLKQFPSVPHIFMPAELRAHVMHWVRDRMLEALQKYNCRITFIDHLHYLFDIGRSRNPSLDIGHVIRTLKAFCVQNETLIFLLCHTVKPKEGDEGLSYEAIRDSSFVAQESDSVFMIRRTPEEGPGYADMRVEFHRRTGVMKEIVHLQKQGHFLVERYAGSE